MTADMLPTKTEITTALTIRLDKENFMARPFYKLAYFCFNLDNRLRRSTGQPRSGNGLSPFIGA